MLCSLGFLVKIFVGFYGFLRFFSGVTNAQPCGEIGF